MPFSLFIIEIIFFFILIRFKKRLSHPLVVVFFITFFYLNAPLLDFYFLDLKISRYFTSYVDFNSDSFLYYCYYKFLFISTFFILLVKKSKYKIHYFEKNQYVFKVKRKNFLTGVLIIMAFYNFNNIITNLGSSRTDLAELQTPFSLVLRNFANYLFIILFCIKVKKDFFYKIFVISSITYFFFSFEREPLVILFFCLVYTKKIFSNSKTLILSSVGLTFILFFWKVFYTSLIYQKGAGIKNVQNFYLEQAFSFTGLDPGSSFKIFYEYLEGTITFSDYYFTYVTGITNQLYRMFFVSNFSTLAEYSSMRLVNDRYGVAFSFLLESVLNFSVFGPIVVAFIIFIFIRKGLQLQVKYGTGIIVCCIYIILKFMRTELATVVKLELFPLFLVLIFFPIILSKIKK